MWRGQSGARAIAFGSVPSAAGRDRPAVDTTLGAGRDHHGGGAACGGLCRSFHLPEAAGSVVLRVRAGLRGGRDCELTDGRDRPGADRAGRGGAQALAGSGGGGGAGWARRFRTRRFGDCGADAGAWPGRAGPGAAMISRFRWPLRRGDPRALQQADCGDAADGCRQARGLATSRFSMPAQILTLAPKRFYPVCRPNICPTRISAGRASRVDGPAKVTGGATYAGDFGAPWAGCMAISSTATIARGRIVSDRQRGRGLAMPGVIAMVLTHENRPRHGLAVEGPLVPGRRGAAGRLRSARCMTTEIHYSGQPVALVVADGFRHGAGCGQPGARSSMRGERRTTPVLEATARDQAEAAADRCGQRHQAAAEGAGATWMAALDGIPVRIEA